MKKLLLLVLLVIGAGIGFYVGNFFGNRTVENYTEHTDLVREIAELSTLEVEGIASLNQTNVTDGSMWSSISNFLGEKTILLNIPYTAKYGCKLGDSSVRVKKVGNKKVEIILANPSLLSYEMRLDRMRQLSKNGLFIFSRDDKFAKPQKKLYQETKSKLEGNQAHINKAKKKVEEVLLRLMKANGIETTFVWED